MKSLRARARKDVQIETLYDRLWDVLKTSIIERSPVLGTAYHYTSAEAAEAILRAKTFWTMDFNAFRDKKEMRHAHEITLNVANDLMKQYAGKPQARALAAFAKNYPDSAIGTIDRDAIFVGCFAHSSDNPLLWRDYARSCSGYCLGLSFGVSDGPPDPNAVAAMAMPVRYDAEAEYSTIREHFERILRTVPLTDDAMIKVAAISMLQVTAFADISFKDRSFEPEDEWRVVVISKAGLGRSAKVVDGPPRRCEVQLENGAPLLLRSLHVGAQASGGLQRAQDLLEELGYARSLAVPAADLCSDAAREPVAP